MQRAEVFAELRKLTGSLTRKQIDSGDAIMDKLGEQVLGEFLGMTSLQLTEKQLTAIYPKAKLSVVPAINKYIGLFGIDTKEELAMFLAQTLHESNGFNSLRENVNYSAERLLVVFPKYFKTLADAKATVAKGQVAICDRIYGNRLGNNANGDGYKYRGGGLLHLTGRSNYVSVYEEFKKLGFKQFDIVTNSDLIIEPDSAVLSGLVWWSQNNMNSLAKDITAASKKVNGGTNGLAERKALYAKALQVL